MAAGKAAAPGLALVDKAPGWTSHDVVAKARGLLGTRQVGHSGTLDPDATGLLVLGVGRGTKLLTHLTGLNKAYTGEAVLGSATTTLDASGEVTGTWDMSDTPLEQVRTAARALTGDIRQVPPMVSAKKVGGRRLHELARQGVEVEREAVPVHVSSFEVSEPAGPGIFPIRVRCSSGTYVRSLVADLGTELGGGAHLRNLRRTSVGPFPVDDAVPIEELSPERVLDPLEAFRGREPAVVDGDLARSVTHGGVLPIAKLAVNGDDVGPWPVVDTEGHLLAVYIPHRSGTAKPATVFTSG